FQFLFQIFKVLGISVTKPSRRFDKSLQTSIIRLSDHDLLRVHDCSSFFTQPVENPAHSLDSSALSTVPLVSIYAASRRDSRPTLASRARSNSRPNKRPILPVARSMAANR